jgi:O-antigen/teichoic acid export membrane protein
MTVARRILVNTLATYLRFLVLALTGLFAIPVALRILGAVDYGIFSVIGGCLAFMMLFNESLHTGAQRYFAYALGEEREEEVTKWFATSLIVHLLLGAVIAGAAVVASHWILHRLLVLPASRLAAATWIYRMVVVAMVCNIVSTPYQALLMAHEAIASMSLLKTLSAIFLMVSIFCLEFLPGDALLWYGAIYCFSQASAALGPAAYCYHRYPECRFRNLSADGLRRRLRELFSFSGWSMLLGLSRVTRLQGPAVVINVFFGPIANAAYGLAVQAQNFVNNITWGFLESAAPSIIKREAAGNNRGMSALSNYSNTYGFGILWIVAAPLIFEAHYCVKLWLRKPPPHTAAFLALMLAALAVDQMTAAYGVTIAATGRLARFAAVVATANCIGVPVGYFLFRAGKPATWVLWAVLAGTLVAGCGRLYFARTLAGISAWEWLRVVLLPAALCAFASTGVILPLIHSLPDNLVRLALVAAANCAAVCLSMWFFGTSADHRSRLRRLAASVSARLLRRATMRAQGAPEEML